MKLLFDQNLSHRLVSSFARRPVPDSRHVRDVGLATADDGEVWSFEREGGFAIVSKDADFHHLSFVAGQPPKVIWIRRGNCSTDDISTLLRSRHFDIEAFNRGPDASFLALD